MEIHIPDSVVNIADNAFNTDAIIVCNSGTYAESRCKELELKVYTKQNGVGVVLLANGALSSGGDEYEIRKCMIENDVVEAIIVLPRNLFYTTDISVSVWVLNKNKKSRVEKRPEGSITYRDRSREILFMDLRQMG